MTGHEVGISLISVLRLLLLSSGQRRRISNRSGSSLGDESPENVIRIYYSANVKNVYWLNSNGGPRRRIYKKRRTEINPPSACTGEDIFDF